MPRELMAQQDHLGQQQDQRNHERRGDHVQGALVVCARCLLPPPQKLVFLGTQPLQRFLNATFNLSCLQGDSDFSIAGGSPTHSRRKRTGDQREFLFDVSLDRVEFTLSFGTIGSQSPEMCQPLRNVLDGGMIAAKQ